MIATLLPDLRTRIIVGVAGVVGVVGAAIGLGGVGEGSTLAQVVRPVAYAVACMAIVRFTTIVRERLAVPFVIHEVAMLAIVLSWVDAGQPAGAIINGAWLVSAAVWFFRS